MGWNITLYTWVSIDSPCAANVVLKFEDGVIYEVLQIGELMLDLVGQH